MSVCTETPLPPGLNFEPAHEYHQRSGAWLSSHLLSKFRKSPLLYWSTIQGKEKDKDRPAYAFGKAAHTYILEGEDVFHREYMPGGPINERTGKPYGADSKKFAEWALNQDKAALHLEHYETIRRMHATVRKHMGAATLLQQGWPEVVVRTKYCGLSCQIRIDWLTYVYSICDLKTCQDYEFFEQDCTNYGYLNQLAFYRAVLRVVLGRTMDVFLIASEKKDPFRCGVWRVKDALLNKHEAENEAAIERLKECQRTNHWPEE